MIARIRKSMQEKDKGFTLIELLVVIIIIGILAAIAIPIFLNQRKKAVDAAAKADVTEIAKQIATYYVDNDDKTQVLVDTDKSYWLSGDGTAKGAGNVAAADALIGPSSLGDNLGDVTVGDGDSAADFSVTLSFDGGTKGPGATFTYDAAAGLTGPTAGA